MADINQIIDPEVVKQLKAMNEQLKEAGEHMDKLVPLMEKINIKTAAAAKKKGDAATNQKQLTEAEKQQLAIQKEIDKNEAKINALNSEAGKLLTKKRIELQQATQAQKEKLKVDQAAEGSLVRMRAKLKELTTAYDNAGTRTKAATKEINDLSRSIGKAEAATNRHQRGVGGYADQMKRLGMQFLGALGITSLVYMFVNVLKGGFDTIKQFSKETAILAGVLEKTRGEIGKLTEDAIRLGAVYPITTMEVVKLQASFAKLGFTQSEILQMTDSTIKASIALNSGLDETATLVGAIVLAYRNLGSEDTAAIVNKLTIAANKSTLGFSEFEMALPKVMAAANAMNISLDETLAMLAVANDATLNAEISGTALKNIFIKLSDSGMTLNEALDQINGSQNKLSTANDIFGVKAAITALALAENKDRVKELTDELIINGDVINAMVKGQMETLAGSVDQMAGAWEALMLSFRNSEGTLSTVTGWITEVFEAIGRGVRMLNNENLNYFDRLFGFIGMKKQAVQEAFSQSLAKANRADLELTIKNNEEKLANGSMYDKNLLKMAKDRLAEILEDEKKAATESAALALKIEREKALALLPEIQKEEKAKKTVKVKAVEKEKTNFMDAANKVDDDLRFAELKSTYDMEALLAAEQLAIKKASEQEWTEYLKNQINERVTAEAAALEQEKQIEEARLTLKTETLNAIGDLAGMFSSMAKEGSAAQIALLAVEKSAAIASIIINTLAANQKAKLTMGPVLGTIWAITNSITAGASIAKIGATTISQFKDKKGNGIPGFLHGTNYAPGGAAYVAEDGKRELIKTPGGKVFLANNPALINLERGSKVLTNRQTEAYLNDGNIVAELRQTRKAIQQIPQPIFRNGSKIAERRGNYWITYRNLKHRQN